MRQEKHGLHNLRKNSIMRRLITFSLIGSLLLLAGCTTAPPAQQSLTVDMLTTGKLSRESVRHLVFPSTSVGLSPSEQAL